MESGVRGKERKEKYGKLFSSRLAIYPLRLTVLTSLQLLL